jgi:hypothetical protein
MRILVGIGSLVSLVIAIIMIFGFFSVRNDYRTRYYYYWDMADKSSTLQQKYDYISKFTDALKQDERQFAQNGALIYKNPGNSFELNLKAVFSLKERLGKIKDMDENSFAYQAAIQQITEQEQGEAQEMICVFYRSWLIENHIGYYFMAMWQIILWAVFIVLGFFWIED